MPQVGAQGGWGLSDPCGLSQCRIFSGSVIQCQAHVPASSVLLNWSCVFAQISALPRHCSQLWPSPYAHTLSEVWSHHISRVRFCTWLSLTETWISLEIFSAELGCFVGFFLFIIVHLRNWLVSMILDFALHDKGSIGRFPSAVTRTGGKEIFIKL